MEIKDLKALQKVITLCRKTGVQSIKIDNIEFHLGEEPIKHTNSQSKEAPTAITPGGITENTKIITDELTAEQLLFYSATPEIYETPEQ